MYFGRIDNFRRSLGWRISLWYALGFIASFLMIGFVASQLIKNSDRKVDRVEIEEGFRENATRCRQMGFEAFRADAEHEQPDRETTLLRLSDAVGRPVLLVPPAGESIDDVQRVERQLQAHRTQGWQRFLNDGQETWQVYGEVMPDGHWLQIAKSNRLGQEAQRRLGKALMPVAALVVVLAMVGAAVLTTRALRPVHRLIDTIHAVIRSGDMTARVPTRAGGGHELDQLNALFNQMLARNENLICGMREALDNVAHDLRTPLTRLRSSAEAALQDESATAKARGEALADAIEESEHTLAMLRVLIDISEAEHGTMRLHHESLALVEVATVASDLYDYLAGERGLRLRVDVSGELRLSADRARLQQVMANLLDNAVKYSSPGGEIRIEGGWADDDHRKVWLRVRDEGIGIAAHDLPRIWDRLYRGDRSRSQRGSGLGLSLVKAIVQAHGGQVEVSSTVDVGSVFTITVPSNGTSSVEAI